MTVPDLYDGHTFMHIGDGTAYAEETGFQELEDAGVRIAGRFPPNLVYIGFSLGVMPAQRLAQTRPGARGAVLVSGCVPLGVYADTWPAGVPVQIHGMDADPIFVDEGDLSAAENLVETSADAELFLYPGSSHLFADISLEDYDETAAPALTARVLEFLALTDA
ncbi:dienelactone hydrolase family protein [Arthrobacter sp. ATA002]|uniref:dienelactone hydrolase family protein n=1 Tax=Arthrobacter sp. ATA002 TaxID=2991715 RepID=UPI0022A6D345|nr:dienelactone hydrolase family protein [Arthrobacter sp. ATA002]WAP52121.1 dienelactone hydrolase family protein [Arthrobacter sp. ATA002]